MGEKRAIFILFDKLEVQKFRISVKNSSKKEAISKLLDKTRARSPREKANLNPA